MNKKVIFHYGNLAGYPKRLAVAFRDKGFRSENVIPSSEDSGASYKLNGEEIKSQRKLGYDRVLSSVDSHPLKKLIHRILFTFQVIRKGKLIHYHSGTLLPFDFDTYIFKFFKIPMFISWGGGDVRITTEALKNNPYAYRFIEPQRDKPVIRRLKRLGKRGITVLSDPETILYSKPYFDKSIIMRAPVDCRELMYLEPRKNIKKIKFLSIQTHPFVKGMIHIENAFKRLEKKGFSFEFESLEATFSQEDFYKKIEQCDVYIDEIKVGYHGLTTLEACAKGKPTIVHIRSDLVKELPENSPFINANPDTIYDVLKDLILNSDKIYELGLQSRKYVEKHYDVNVVADSLIHNYKESGVNL